MHHLLYSVWIFYNYHIDSTPSIYPLFNSTASFECQQEPGFYVELLSDELWPFLSFISYMNVGFVKVADQTLAARVFPNRNKNKFEH